MNLQMSRLRIALLIGTAMLAGCSSPPQNGVRTINIVAKRYAFQPETVRIRLGETVILHVTTPDVQHGFRVTALDLHESVQPNVPADIVLHATRAGHFRIDCDIKCGKGHDEMTGKIVIE